MGRGQNSEAASGAPGAVADLVGCHHRGVTGGRALLGDVLPDIRRDLSTGVRGWPHRLGPDSARLLPPAPLVTASAVLALGSAGSPGRWGCAALAVAGPAAVAGTVLGRRWEQAAFAAAVTVAVVDVALLLRGTGIA